MFGAEKIVTDLLKGADIIVNGNRPWDVQIHDKRVYGRVLFEGSYGLGQSYVEGWWDCDDIPEFINRLLRVNADRRIKGIRGRLLHYANKTWNTHTIFREREAIEHHYDMGTLLYENMLDKRLVYTCGYWKDAKTLDEAQEQKLDLVCRKLNLQAGQRVLDIGCGFGSFAKFAAERYGVEVTGITLSKDQIALGQELCKGLPVTLLLLNYQNLLKKFPPQYFDHVVSLGMFEHVGPRNYRKYFEIVSKILKPEGLFLHHTITGEWGGAEAWIEANIFPEGFIPSHTQIIQDVKDLFVIEDVHNFGADYDKTLCAWDANFVSARAVLEKSGKYDERFFRMWHYYLTCCAGSFRARKNQLWQTVLSPQGVMGGYHRVS